MSFSEPGIILASLFGLMCIVSSITELAKAPISRGMPSSLSSNSYIVVSLQMQYLRRRMSTGSAVAGVAILV